MREYTGTSLEDQYVNSIVSKAYIDEVVYHDLNNPAPLWVNILIRHFDDKDSDKITITEEELKSLDNDLIIADSMRMFYMIPLVIYCLETAIEKVLN